MAIYIQSRGKNQDQDYRWLRIKSSEYYPENPNFLLQPIKNLSVRPIDLIESNKFSIILVNQKNDYYLLITGLESKERTDFMGRPVRNSILWICQKDSDNLKIRSLLIRALRAELEEQLDKSITNAGKYGFEVDYDCLKHLSNSTLDIQNNQNIDLSCKIGKNYDSLKEELTLELENNVLPNREGLLVLVTSIKSASALKKTNVWRGLSNRVEFENFFKYKEFKGYDSLRITKSENQKKKIGILSVLIIILLLAIAITIRLVILNQSPIKINTHPPQTEKSTSPSVQKIFSNLSEKELNSMKSPLTCQIAKEKNFFLSPCFLNNKNN